MIRRGKDIQHHNIVNDMMTTTEVTYRPQPGVDKPSKDSSIVAVITMGFVKDAKSHIDVQGCNVYHKSRLIKPFWRLGNNTGIDGVLTTIKLEMLHESIETTWMIKVHQNHQFLFQINIKKLGSLQKSTPLTEDIHDDDLQTTSNLYSVNKGARNWNRRICSTKRERRDIEEEALRKKLKHELIKKVKMPKISKNRSQNTHIPTTIIQNYSVFRS